MSTEPTEFDRRGFLNWVRHGLGSAALASVMLKDGSLRAASVAGEARDSPPHHAPKARRAIHICLCGAMSQVDTFDFKPELVRLHGKSLVTPEKPDVFFGQVGLLRAPDWSFQQRGESGIWVSELIPHIAQVADEQTLIKTQSIFEIV